MDRMEQYCIANSVAEEKRVAVFLTAIGGATYELLRNLLSPDAPKDKSLDELKSTLRAHLKPKSLTIAERFKFYRRTQREGESVADYVVALKELSTHCDFGTFLNDALRDRLVCGLYKEATQKRLLTEAELTFKKACEIAQVMEMADKNASELKSEETEPSINVLEKPPGEVRKTLAKDSSQVKEIATAVEDRILHLVAVLRLKNAENVAKLVTSRGSAIPKMPSKGR